MNYTHDQVIELLKKRQGDRTLREFGAELGVSASYLCDIYAGKRNPGPQVLRGLKLDKVTQATVIYKRQKRAS